MPTGSALLFVGSFVARTVPVWYGIQEGINDNLAYV